MSDKKINCVILNYNDAETTEKLVKNICGYDCLHQIVVVDNASTDDSLVRLKLLEDSKVIVISAESNGGYGAGNNLGAEYSFQKSGADHIIIANPDTMFTESCVKEMSRVLGRHSDVGVIAASMEDAAYGTQRNGWPLQGFMGALLSMGPVSRRLFRRWLTYPESYFKDKKAVYVGGVHGSMLMIERGAFIDCGGYDEKIFLYQEEAVLATRMKKAGYRTVLLLNQNYQHEHSASIGKTYQGQMERQKLRHDSVMYYFKEYLHLNPVQEVFARCWFSVILLEIYLAGILKFI